MAAMLPGYQNAHTGYARGCRRLLKTLCDRRWADVRARLHREHCSGACLVLERPGAAFFVVYGS
jgi:hypothetical protein